MQTKKHHYKSILLFLSALILLLCVIAGVYRGRFDVISLSEAVQERLDITFLDIGQGDATFIRFPDTTTMLIDCARDARVLEALSRVMDFDERRIDILVLTHPDADHFGGCADVLKRFEVEKVLYTGFHKEDDFFESFKREIDNEVKGGASYISIDKEQKWIIASTTVHFLFPDKPVEDMAFESNDTSIVMRLEYGASSVLLTGDAEFELEQYLIKKYGTYLQSDVLKVGHHGSDTSSIREFIDRVKPQHAIISSGRENAYGHPSRRVVKRLQRSGSVVWRTDVQGDILVTLTTSTIHVENHETM